MIPMHRALTLFAAVLLGSALLGACDGGELARPRPSPTVRPEPIPGSTRGAVRDPECENQERVASNPSARKPGMLAGDVIGDGSQDRIFIAEDPRGEGPCRAFVVAETSRGELAAPIDAGDIPFELGMPALGGFAEVDSVAGFEIMVDIVVGASTQFAGLFTVRGDGLVRMHIEGSEPPAADLFPYGGSVGHVEASDCDPEASDRVVISAAIPAEDRYTLERKFYRVAGSDFVPEESELHTVRFRELNDFPEFLGSPFGSCGQ